MKKLVISLMAALLLTVTVFGQTPTGRLLGVVSTADGVLPNATVTVTFNQTGRTQTATTGEDGTFSFAQLEPGTYTVTVTASGFKTFTANEVKIDVGREYNLTPTLEVGSVQETVTVTAGADVITSTTAQITNTVSPQQILTLPLVERNPLDLVALQPGAVSNPTTGLTTINGMRTSTTNTTRDGISINDPFIRSNATDFAPGRPSVDDTGEFTITTSNQESDQGGGGAQITLVTPRGTKDFHGALFEYNRNSYFAANDFFNKLSGTDRPFRNRNQYGGKIGGMIPVPNFGENDGPLFLKDKAFFFFAYEGIKDPDSDRYTRTILTPSARAGTFTFRRSAAGVPFSSNGLSCPSGDLNSTCTVTNILAFAQAQGFQGIPSTINPIIQQRILDNLPTEGNTTGGDGLNTTGYALNRRFDNFRNTYTTRLDLDATQKDNLSFVYSWNREDLLRPDVDDTGFTTVPDVTQYSENETMTFAYRRAFTSNFVNEFRYGRFTSVVPFDRVSEYPAYNLGPGNVTTSSAQGLIAGLISNPENVFLDQGRASKVTTFADNANFIVGKHSLRFGGLYQRYNVNTYNDAIIVPFYNIGTTNLSPETSTTFQANVNFPNVCAGTCGANATSVVNATQLAQANGLLALLAGLINQGEQAFNMRDIESGFLRLERSQQPFTNWNHALYVTDRWQAARGLTINGGVRWEIYPALRLDTGLALEAVVDPDNPEASLLAGNGTYNVVGTNSGGDFRYYKTDYNNFAPAFSFAYTPNFEKGIGSLLFGREGRTVIRGGFSSTYANDQIITSLSSTISGNVGLGRQRVQLIGPNNTTALNERLDDSLPVVPIPTFNSANITRTFLQNNTNTQGFFGLAGVVDPNLQIPRTDQYTFGIQRELPGNMVIEARYVGARSNNLVRGYNPNQIDIINNGFLADFRRAQNNLATSAAFVAAQRATNPSFPDVTSAFCNPAAIAGCQALTILRNAAAPQVFNGTQFTIGGTATGAPGTLIVGTTLTGATFNTQLRNGTVADLAQLFVTNNLNNHPSVANPTATPFVKFYPNPNIGTINLLTNAGRFNYNGLQIELRRRFSDGLYFQGNYTFSKTLTNGRGNTQQLSEPFLQNQDPDLDYQRADNDVTHVFNFNGIYQLPFGRGKRFLSDGGFLNQIVGGWEVSGLLTTQSGVPITFIDTRGTLNRGALSGQQTVSSTLTARQIQDLIGLYEVDGKFYYIDPSVIGPTGQGATGYVDPTLPGLNSNTTFPGQIFFLNAPGTTGNLGRAIVNGPGYWNVNAALLKNFRFGESVRLQLRMEAFNLFNNVNFRNGAQYTSPTSTTFGQLLSTTGPREVQFAARFEF